MFQGRYNRHLLTVSQQKRREEYQDKYVAEVEIKRREKEHDSRERGQTQAGVKKEILA